MLRHFSHPTEFFLFHLGTFETEGGDLPADVLPGWEAWHHEENGMAMADMADMAYY